MAKCYNCERLLCSHKYGIANQYEGECSNYLPHYIDEDIPIGSAEDDKWVNLAEELIDVFDEESEEENEASN